MTFQVLPGAEIDLAYGLDLSDDELRVLAGGNGTALLVETPYGPVSDLFEEQLFSLSLRGFRPLLAHPERNRAFQENPERLAGLTGRGVLLQVTAEALLRSPRRSATGRLATDLVERGLASVLASDSHGGHIQRESLSEGLAAAERAGRPGRRGAGGGRSGGDRRRTAATRPAPARGSPPALRAPPPG